jgi:hypothetical protein
MFGADVNSGYKKTEANRVFNCRYDFIETGCRKEAEMHSSDPFCRWRKNSTPFLIRTANGSSNLGSAYRITSVINESMSPLVVCEPGDGGVTCLVCSLHAWGFTYSSIIRFFWLCKWWWVNPANHVISYLNIILAGSRR